MRNIREVLRLKYECQLSNVKISLSCHISRESVRQYLKRAQEAKLAWPLPDSVDDERLEHLLFPQAYSLGETTKPDPHWIHQELKRKGVTRWLLWEEYRSLHPEGVGYTQFCESYRQFKATLEPVMRQTHKAGEKCFVDYAGHTIPWIDKLTGEIKEAQIFVAVLGASNYTYVEATASQTVVDWIGSHVRTFQFLGGVPKILVPDNLKSGITSPHLYDPHLNLTYQDLANHYGIAIIPARVAKPKDKAKVEVGVQGIERRILAKLRHHTFFSVAQINEAIKPLLVEYNHRPFQNLPASRASEFQAIDKPALKGLPVHSYEYAEWRKARAGIDYHVAFERHYYSVPYRYIKQEIDMRITATLIQGFFKGKLIAAHVRAFKKGHTTVKEHMPAKHRAYAEWTPRRLLKWAKQNGESTEQFVHALLASRVVPEQAFRACLGVLRLAKQYSVPRLEKASARALSLGAISYKSVESILKHGLDDKPLPAPSNQTRVQPITHDNLRGRDYYH